MPSITSLQPPRQPQSCQTTAQLLLGARGKTLEGDFLGLDFDDYVRYRLFVELPPILEPTTVRLSGKSFVHLLGHYEIPAESKLFFPVSGTLVIDSLAHGKMFATIDGRYENTEKVPLRINGRFKTKVAF